jgi:hypothetical protein
MPVTLRGTLEPLFAADFSQVRLHDDSVSHQAARDVDAHAFTVGSHVHFGSGQFRPDDRAGMHLLAHELTHTIQQGEATVSGSDALEVDRPDSAHEREADSLADHVAHELGSGAPGPVAGPSAVHDAARPTVSRSARARVQRVGFGEFLSRLFGEGTFSDKELSDYLKFLDDNARIEGDYDSDNKAREIVRRWRADKSTYDLYLPRKQLLLLELIDGPTLDDDEHAILELLRGSTTAEVAALIAAAGGEEELKGEFQGPQSDELDAFLAEWHARDVKSQPKQHAKRGKGVFAPNEIAEIQVNQTTPQTVIVRYGDNRTESDICSTGKGTCCVQPGTSQAPSDADTIEEDTNWTPNGPHVVREKVEDHKGISWWMEINKARAIALHEYSPVDGTPLSHGCIRLHSSFAKKIYPAVVEGATRVFIKGTPRPRCNHGPLQTEWEHDFSGAVAKDGDPELIKHMHKTFGWGKKYDDAMAKKVIPSCPARGRP